MGHKRRFDEPELRKMLESRGFQIEHEHQINKIGALSWWFFGKVLRRAKMSRPGLKLWDKTVWFWRRVDFLLPHRAVRAIDLDVAELGAAGARADVMEKTWDVRRALVAAGSDRESAHRRLDIATRLAAAEDRLIALQRRRVDAGEDAPTDLIASQNARLDIEQQLARARADAVAADAALAAALGMPAAALDGIAIEWPDWGAPPVVASEDIARAREAALLSRADLASAIDAYATAEKKLERAIARQYPEFSLKPGYYWDHGIAKWPFEVDFALPVFNRNEGEIAEAKAAREVAGQKLLRLQAEIFGEIDAMKFRSSVEIFGV